MSDNKAPRPAGLVISSITGKPISLSPESSETIPRRSPADEGNDSNDERLVRDVPPHWGK